MSVIAKMYVNESLKYGNGHLVAFACIAENELMAGYAKPEHEDILFSRASPNGSARLTFQNDPQVEQQSQCYFIFQKGEKPNLEGALAWAKVKVYGITDYGGLTKQVEILGDAPYDRKFTDSIELLNVNYKISIDNPGASNQFKAGESGWWLTIYKSSQMTQHEALALALAAKGPVDDSEPDM